MKKIKFSIIIPAYNAEKTIKSCVDSVLAQDYDSYEIIIVDDGSKDATARILREEYGNNKKITVLSQENKGVSAARNRALKAASGEWIIFLDSDDNFSPDALRMIWPVLERIEPDCLITKLDRGDSRKTKERERIYDVNDEVVNAAIFCEGTYSNKSYLSDFDVRGIGGKVYRAELIKQHSVRFPEDLKKFEDGLFNIEFFLLSKRVACSPLVFYHYSCNNPTSRTNTLYENEYIDNVVIMERITRLIGANYADNEAINNVALPLFILSIDCIYRKNWHRHKKTFESKRLHAFFLPFLRKTNGKRFGLKKKIELSLSRRKSIRLLSFLYLMKNFVRFGK